ncbi:ribosome maturation factor RimM [Lusitaniella coriacea LEGE 07157]|uniref:Ribosome maturation factor RimM n=1 Tax=Lusitaniella coriacea LEGE 07157 TaxID=945747 RepID=A0A8J7IWH6_9CYAN|nr:ribosome maturation factor RimM [Lusitaniella coriacea]MBE9118048.1 ribosome maturation factor RimM [Lusitaniella coriacea LEGE 07157]
MSNSEQNEVQWIEIGTIVGVKGLKGELRVHSDSDFPERFEQPGTRWLQAPNNISPQAIELLRGQRLPGKNVYVVKLKGIDNRDRAEALRDYTLLVPQGDRPQLEEDEYHVSDLIDLEAIDRRTGEAIGKVIDVFTAGNDLLEVQLYNQPTPEIKEVPDLSAISRKSKRRKQRSPKPPKPATVLIPFVKEIVPAIDLESGRVEIVPPPGLLEIELDNEK